MAPVGETTRGRLKGIPGRGLEIIFFGGLGCFGNTGHHGGENREYASHGRGGAYHHPIDIGEYGGGANGSYGGLTDSPYRPESGCFPK